MAHDAPPPTTPPSTGSAPQRALTRAWEAHRASVWGLCYRMTGSRADADDLTQDTFARALARPPADTTRPWGPWLLTVAMNLSRDALRRRKRRAYDGPWLPTLAPTDALAQPWAWGDGAGRYEALESATVAFLSALEALGPQQRAVLLLRDVVDLSTQETADALDLSISHTKTTLHRARKRMAAYDADVARRHSLDGLSAASVHALQTFMRAVADGDRATMTRLLVQDVALVNDSGGEFLSARRPLHGRRAVCAFLEGIQRKSTPRVTQVQASLRNGTCALDVHVDHTTPRAARRTLLACDLDPDGHIRTLYLYVSTAKLRDAAR